MVTTAKRKVYISVLNWNGTDATTACVDSILNLEQVNGIEFSVLVIDNGSTSTQWESLRQAMDKRSSVTLLRNTSNLGFAGGHNVAMRRALEDGAEFMWLVNSDALVRPGSLASLLELMDADATCGASSPLVLALHDEKVIDFCGARHDWMNLTSIDCKTPAEAARMEEEHPLDMWLMGAAIFLRATAIHDVGLLDDRYFAYYEDNDLCARLSASGWRCRMAFNAVVAHAHPTSRIRDKPPYYFYLMARNSFFFWMRHTPKGHRKLLRLKLVDRALLVANRLHNQNYQDKKAACLLGIFDAQIGKSGKWRLDRPVPLVMRAFRAILWKNHSQHLHISDA